jgi:hypothetical protein
MTQDKASPTPSRPRRAMLKSAGRGIHRSNLGPGISPELISALRAAVADSPAADALQQLPERNSRRFRGLR